MEPHMGWPRMSRAISFRAAWIGLNNAIVRLSQAGAGHDCRGKQGRAHGPSARSRDAQTRAPRDRDWRVDGEVRCAPTHCHGVAAHRTDRIRCHTYICGGLAGGADRAGDGCCTADGTRRSQRALLQLSALPLPMCLVQPAILGRRYLGVSRDTTMQVINRSWGHYWGYRCDAATRRDCLSRHFHSQCKSLSRHQSANALRPREFRQSSTRRMPTL